MKSKNKFKCNECKRSYPKYLGMNIIAGKKTYYTLCRGCMVKWPLYPQKVS